MSYEFKAGMMYRMPTHFGPSLGPRQGPDGRKFACKDNPKTTSISISFRSNAEQLSALLPPGFSLDGVPLVTVYASFMKEIEWLAGRGYNVLGVTIPAIYEGKETARGPFLTVLWESLADPIITGREDIGFSKIYCEIPDPRFCSGSAAGSAGWLGFNFLDFEVGDLVEDSSENTSSNTDGMLHYKYIPKTGVWGEADSAYPVITPTGSNERIIEKWQGKGSMTWHRARWEDLPTFYPVVNAFADLPIEEYVSASVVKSIGGKDLSNQRILS
jgi:hypothetical protein